MARVPPGPQHQAASSPWSGKELARAGCLPNLSESCSSESLKTPARRRTAREGREPDRRRPEAEGHEFTSPATWHPPPAQWLCYPVGSGRCFCRVILSCPEGSWPRATFLGGSECHRGRKLPFSPDPSTPAQHTVRSPSSLCRQQTLSSEPVWVLPAEPLPSLDPDSGQAENIPQGGKDASVPREESLGLRGGGQMGIEEPFKTLHLPTHWTLLPVGVHQPHGEGAYYSRRGLGRAPLKLETRQGSLEASSLGPCCPPPSTCSIPLCKILASPDQQGATPSAELTVQEPTCRGPY